MDRLKRQNQLIKCVRVRITCPLTILARGCRNHKPLNAILLYIISHRYRKLYCNVQGRSQCWSTGSGDNFPSTAIFHESSTFWNRIFFKIEKFFERYNTVCFIYLQKIKSFFKEYCCYQVTIYKKKTKRN